MKIKNANSLFKKIEAGLTKIGFQKLTPQQKERAKKIVGYKPPKGLGRIIETAPQIEFQKEVDGYKVKILTSYREDLERFTKAGKIWCHILGPKVDKGEDTKYTRIIKRRGNFIERAFSEAQFLLYALDNRPLDTRNRPMVLKEEPRGFFFWVSVGDEKERVDFYHAVPDGCRREILKNKYTREYYITVQRDRLGIKEWERDIRKKGKNKTPNNIVPVIY